MDFGRSPDEAAFADEVRAFLRAQPPDTFPSDGTDAGYGSGAHSRAFTRAIEERGWLSLTWQRAQGGQTIGLLGMEERIRLAGGAFEIVSALGQGTRLELCFPLAEPDQSQQLGTVEVLVP